MIMIGHQHISVETQPEEFAASGEKLDKMHSIPFIPVNGLALVAPGRHMIIPPGSVVIAWPWDAECIYWRYYVKLMFNV